MNSMSQLFYSAQIFNNIYLTNNKAEKEKIKKEWEESKKYPRKKKKKIRKELLFKWEILHYDILF